MIGVLSTAEDRDENFEQNIEDCEEVNEKTADYDDSRRDYRVGHCRIDGHRQLKRLIDCTNYSTRHVNGITLKTAP